MAPSLLVATVVESVPEYGSEATEQAFASTLKRNRRCVHVASTIPHKQQLETGAGRTPGTRRRFSFKVRRHTAAVCFQGQSSVMKLNSAGIGTARAAPGAVTSARSR